MPPYVRRANRDLPRALALLCKAGPMTDMLLGAGFILFLVLAGLAVLLRGRRARPHRGRRRQQATGLGTTAGVFDAAWLAGSDQTGDSGGGHSGDSGGGGCGGGGCGGGV